MPACVSKGNPKGLVMMLVDRTDSIASGGQYLLSARFDTSLASKKYSPED
jgi:hypothetical protein